jgi:hypothetical protein
MKTAKSRLPLHTGDPELREKREEVISHLSEGAPSRPNRLVSDLLPARQADSQRVQVAITTTEPTPGIALPCQQGDSAGAISNSNFFPKRFCEGERIRIRYPQRASHARIAFTVNRSTCRGDPFMEATLQ